VHTPAAHHSPAAQSDSELQVARQEVAPQAYGAHAWVWTAGQLPAPSQAAATVATPVLQLGARQLVPSEG
jgi:hypothetical protein